MTIDGAQILTVSGEYVWPLYPAHWTPRIEDIAHALSMQCRFTGHTSEFYSVGQHSIHVSDLLPEGLQLAGLLHDAAEAYLGDLCTPLKRHPFGEAYRSAERALSARIEETFQVSLDHDLVHHADRVMLAAERRDLMPDVEGEWLILRGVRARPERVVPMPPMWAREMFLRRYRRLTERVAA